MKRPLDRVASLYVFGEPIEPQSEIEVQAGMSTTRVGARTVRVRLETNEEWEDGADRPRALSLTATSQPFLRASVGWITFGEVHPGVSRASTVMFEAKDSTPVALSLAAPGRVPIPEGLSVELTALDPDPSGRSPRWRAEVSVSDEVPPGSYGATLRFVTDVAPAATRGTQSSAKVGRPVPFHSIALNVSYRVMAPVEFEGAYASFGLVRPGEVVVRTVRMKSNRFQLDPAHLKYDLKGVGEAELPWKDHFEVEFLPVEGQNAVDVRLRLIGLPSDANGSFRGVLSVDPGTPEGSPPPLRFSGVCRPPVQNRKSGR